MKFEITPVYKNKQKTVLHLIEYFHTEGSLLVKGSRNSIKTNFLDQEKVNIKYFARPSWIKGIVYTFFRESKAKRSYDYAHYLMKYKILTPQPIAYFESFKKGLLSESFYMTQHLDYDFTFRELIHDPLFPQRDLILEQFTEFTFRLHEANINFLDHSPGNTLILNKGNNQYDFYLIDLNRMKFEELSIEKRMDNFKKMWISKYMIKVIARKYAELSGYAEKELFDLLMKTSTAFKRKINKKKYLKRKFKRSK